MTVRSLHVRLGPPALALVVLLLMVACGGGTTTTAGGETPTTVSGAATTGAEPTGLTPLAVGVIPITDVAPLYVAIDQGFFADQGLEVTPTLAQGGAAIIPGVESGEFQIGFSNVVSLINAVSAGLDVRVIADGMKANQEPPDWGAILVGADSDVTDPAGLEGKTIAVNTLQNIGEVTIKASLEAQGVDISTLEFLEMPLPDMPAALAGGDVEAIWTVEPFVTISQSEGAQVIDYNYIGTEPGMEIAVYFTTGEYADANPAVITGFQQAIAQASEAITADEQVMRDIITTYTSVTPELAADIVVGQFTGEVSNSSIENTANLMVQQGIIEEVPDLSSVLP